MQEKISRDLALLAKNEQQLGDYVWSTYSVLAIAKRGLYHANRSLLFIAPPLQSQKQGLTLVCTLPRLDTVCQTRGLFMKMRDYSSFSSKHS